MHKRHHLVCSCAFLLFDYVACMQVTLKVKDRDIKYTLVPTIVLEYSASEHAASSGAHTSIQKALYVRDP
jgi:hypothetical protein